MFMRSLVAVALFLGIVAVPLVGHSEILPKAVVRFTGQEIRDSQQSGLIVYQAKGIPFIAVGSAYHDYTLLLPYSDAWELESGTEVPLFARDKRYIASVMIGASPITTPLAYYDNFLDNMKKSGEYETRSVEIIKAPNTGKPLLRYQTRKAGLSKEAQDMNRWVWNYWVAVPYGSLWYALHLSVADDDEEKFRREERKVTFALDSLSPGMLKRKPADISREK